MGMFQTVSFLETCFGFCGPIFEVQFALFTKRLCPLGARGVLAQLDKSVMRVLMIGLVTSAKM